MPLIKLDPNTPKYKYLKPLVGNRLDIVKDYNNMKSDPEIVKHFCITNWNLLNLYNVRDGIPESISNFPTIEKFINTLPENIELIMICISVMDYGDTVFHAEEWTNEKGYYRIHVPLNVVDGASIIVKEPDGNDVTYTYELDNVYQFENPYDFHKPSNFHKSGETRLLFMMDLIDRNENPDITKEQIAEKYPIEFFTTPPT